MNAFLNAVVLLVLVAVALGVGYALGTRRERAARPRATPDVARRDDDGPATPATETTATSPVSHRCAAQVQARAIDDDRASLFRALADARTETARYR